jgi:hypothetical protein
LFLASRVQQQPADTYDIHFGRLDFDVDGAAGRPATAMDAAVVSTSRRGPPPPRSGDGSRRLKQKCCRRTVHNARVVPGGIVRGRARRHDRRCTAGIYVVVGMHASITKMASYTFNHESKSESYKFEHFRSFRVFGSHPFPIGCLTTEL